MYTKSCKVRNTKQTGKQTYEVSIALQKFLVELHTTPFLHHTYKRGVELREMNSPGKAFTVYAPPDTGATLTSPFAELNNQAMARLSIDFSEHFDWICIMNGAQTDCPF